MDFKFENPMGFQESDAPTLDTMDPTTALYNTIEEALKKYQADPKADDDTVSAVMALMDQLGGSNYAGSGNADLDEAIFGSKRSHKKFLETLREHNELHGRTVDKKIDFVFEDA